MMLTIIIAVLVGLLFGRVLFPALFGVAAALVLPVVALLRPALRTLAGVLGAVLVAPCLPFIFLWTYFATLLRRKTPAGQPAASPAREAGQRTAQVIDLATARRRRTRQPPG